MYKSSASVYGKQVIHGWANSLNILRQDADMARITVLQAHRAGYASRATIYRRINLGKLSVHEIGGTTLVDVADLVRLFGEPGEKKGEPEKLQGPDVATRAKLEAAVELLEAELLAANRDRDEAQRRASDVQDKAEAERDRLLAIVETTQRLLEDQSKERETQRKGFWRRLVG